MLLGVDAVLALIDIPVDGTRLLDETLALALAFVGLKALLAQLVPAGAPASLAVIAGLPLGGAGASVVPR